MRTFRKGRYKYMRNYQPFNIDGLYNAYRYRMLAYREWRDLYRAGRLNAVQRQFFEPREAEALYDLETDPYETVNLAGDPAHAEILATMRNRLGTLVRSLPDLSFYPESVLAETAFDDPVAFGLGHREAIAALADVADLALVGFPPSQEGIAAALGSSDPWTRYWGLIVCSSYGSQAEAFVPTAKAMAAGDAENLVRVRAAEFLALAGVQDPAPVIRQALARAGSRQEALLILNTAALLTDVRPAFRLDLSAEDVPAAWRQGGPRTDVNQRLRYITGRSRDPRAG